MEQLSCESMTNCSTFIMQSTLSWQSCSTWQIYNVCCLFAIYAVLTQHPFRRILRTFVWSKNNPQILSVEKKWQLSCMCLSEAFFFNMAIIHIWQQLWDRTPPSKNFLTTVHIRLLLHQVSPVWLRFGLGPLQLQ